MISTASYIEEACIVDFHGQTFESGGALVSDQFVIGYVRGLQDAKVNGLRSANWRSEAVIINWHGEQVLGQITNAKSWHTPRSYMASHMWQITALIEGVFYTGRGCGDGMIWRGRRCADQSKGRKS